ELDGVDGVGRRAAARGIKELGAHDARRPIHTHDAKGVVADGANGPRDMRAVVVVVQGITGVVNCVKTVRTGGTRDEAAADVDREGGGRRPDIRGQIRMRVVDASIDYGYDVGARACRDIPRESGADVCARRAGNSENGLAGVP